MTLLTAMLILILPVCALAEWIGEVISQQVTFREEPSERAKMISRIGNGTELTILDTDAPGWYHIFFNGKDGYVMDQYIIENPDHLTLLSSTPVYPYPRAYKRIAALSSYTRLTIIDEYDIYYVVNLRQASGFIRKTANLMLDSETLAAPRIGNVIIDKAITPRNGPAASYTAAGSELQPGISLEYTGKSADWYLVLIDGRRPAYIPGSACHLATDD